MSERPEGVGSWYLNEVLDLLRREVDLPAKSNKPRSEAPAR